VNFFARQEQSRRTSRALVVAFFLAFVVVALATTIAAAAALRLYTENNALFLGTETWRQWVDGHGGLVLGVALGTFGLMVIASLYRAATLARGGGQVAQMLGGTRITGEGSDPLERRLVNVVEEMALASGVPVPEVYVLDQEAGINAFAAGLTPANAAIAVTRGALEHLERAELQGVIAHEFSHILNGDMRLNQQLIGLSFGILVLSLAGRWLLRSVRYAGGGRRGRNSGGIAAALGIGFALVVIGGIGVLLSRFIKAGVSRQRERLADASAVQFTREPEGLAGALKKIGGYSARIESVDTEEVAHMLFERGTRPLAGWFATHPPLLERIRALEPNFDPRDLPAPSRRPLAARPAETLHGASAAGLVAPARMAGVSQMQEQFASAAAAVASAASPLERAGEIAAPAGRALRESVPDEVYHATRSRDSSLLLVAALALSADEPTRRKQLALVERQLGATRAELTERLFAELAPSAAELRLPVLELALPTLRQRPREQVAYLGELLTRIQELEPTPRLFDFVLMRVLKTYLQDPRSAAPAAKRYDARSAVRSLLANVAAFGHEHAAAARAAYDAGLAALGWRGEPGDPKFEPPAAARDLAGLDAALAALAPIRPRDKERVLRGVHAAIRADTVTGVEERELFRLIAIVLDCPLPPDVAL
jgi:Zn-dependent protease with chaperone function